MNYIYGVGIVLLIVILLDLCFGRPVLGQKSPFER